MSNSNQCSMTPEQKDRLRRILRQFRAGALSASSTYHRICAVFLPEPYARREEQDPITALGGCHG